jgi:hypothetical protein
MEEFLSIENELKGEACEMIDENEKNEKNEKNEQFEKNEKNIDEYSEFLHKVKIKYEIMDYMPKQSEITTEMREILVSFLINSSEACKFHTEPTFLAVNILDRYISIKSCTKETFQLIGIVSFMIAAKFQETKYPSIESIAKLCLNKYSREEIISMEKDILQTIDYKLIVCTALSVLCNNFKRLDKKLFLIAQCLAEMCLLDYKYSAICPFKLSRACVLFASEILVRHKNFNPCNSPNPSKYKKENFLVKEIEKDALKLFESDNYYCIHAKYSTSRLCNVFYTLKRVIKIDDIVK